LYFKTRYFQYYLVVFIVTLLSVASLNVYQAELVNASSKSPHESGFDHGCDDADISDPDERYINQPEKGPSFHTDEFMDGYDSGFNSCSGDNDGSERASSDGSSSSSGYSLTVTVTSHPFGASAVDIDILTENGYRDSKKVSTAGDATASFDIPSNQGTSVEVCVDAGLLHFENCKKYTANGDDMSVSLSAET
jgi:hypothetical protein